MRGDKKKKKGLCGGGVREKNEKLKLSFKNIKKSTSNDRDYS
jgi:hypothetical protein